MFKITLLTILALSWTLVTSFSDRNTRVYDGRNALPGEVPYIASLRFWSTTFHFASGNLVSNRWIVTVANPLVGRAANSISIVVGTNMLNAGVVNRRSDRIRIHESYNPVTRRNDIACIRSATTIPFSSFVNQIPLSTFIVPDATIGVISGWGATRGSLGADSNILQTATATTAACVDNDVIAFGPGHICAGAVATPRTITQASAICTTDIGGPMAFNNQLIGIAAWHPSPCTSELDGYNRVSYYRAWIMGVITT